VRGAIDRRNEPVSTSRECLDENWGVRRFTQRIAQPLDRSIETMIKIDKGVRWPEPVANFFSRNQLAGMLQEQT
jgi:hypothetical protein